MYILYIVFAILAIFGGGAYALKPDPPQDIVVARSHSAGESNAQVARALRRAYQNNPSLFPTPAGGQPVQIPTAVVEGLGTLTAGYATQADVEFWLDANGRIFPLDRSTNRRDPALSEAAFMRTGPLTAPKTFDRPPTVAPADDGTTTIQGPGR
jgi:hypothetical protein